MSDNMSPIEQLLSEDNTDNIVLYDENGTPTEFVQVAIIPVGNKTYAILSPATPMEGVEEDEGLVFSIDIDERSGDAALNLIDDSDVIDKVFDLYIELLTEGE